MKKSVICIAMAGTLLFSSCLGTFSAFNNLKDWNQGVSDSKFVNNLVFWGLNIIPVYGLFFLGDAIIFNVIEFWSGSNPIAMEEGESETVQIERLGVGFTHFPLEFGAHLRRISNTHVPYVTNVYTKDNKE